MIYQFFRSSPIIVVTIKSVFLKGVSTGNGNFWDFTSSSVFFSQYFLVIFLWCDLYGQYWFHIYFAWCQCWVVLVLILLGRYSQRECQIIVLVFQNKWCSLLPRGCNMFQHKGIICNYCRPMRIHRDHRIFWSFFTVTKIDFSKSYHNFPAGFVPCI